MTLPDVFQMRVASMPGFTHSVSKNSHGDYEVKWARGYPGALGKIPKKTFDEHSASFYVQNGGWIIVEEAPKAPVKPADERLPNVFYFTCPKSPTVYTAMRRSDTEYVVSWDWGFETDMLNSHVYHEDTLNWKIKADGWKRCEAPVKPVLTAEQKRFNEEYKQQIVQLEMSVKIAEQSAEHQRRLAENYMSRISDLKDKIVEE